MGGLSMLVSTQEMGRGSASAGLAMRASVAIRARGFMEFSQNRRNGACGARRLLRHTVTRYLLAGALASGAGVALLGCVHCCAAGAAVDDCSGCG